MTTNTDDKARADAALREYAEQLSNEGAVRALGERIGYEAVIRVAEQQWRAALEATGVNSTTISAMLDLDRAAVSGKRPETVIELKRYTNLLLEVTRALMGPRCSAVLMIGIPVDGESHDRFAANVVGPCLSTRGLLAWGKSQVEQLIDAGDSSKNGKTPA